MSRPGGAGLRAQDVRFSTALWPDCAVVSPEFVLYTRRDCGLCAEMRAALHAAAGSRRYQCHLVDVDEDPALRRRFGTRVPVLAAAGRVLCEARFDENAVRGYLEGFGSD